MENYRNEKMFVCAVEVGEYRNNVVISACIITTICMVVAVLVDINVFSIIGCAMGITLIVVYISLSVKKDIKNILLFECLQGMLLALSMCLVFPSILFYGGLYVTAIILEIACIIVASTVSALLIRSRIKRNYYEWNQSNVASNATIIVMGPVAGFVGMKFGEGIAPNYCVLMIFSAIVASFFGFKTTESLIRYIIARRYNLLTAVRVKTDY